MTSDRGNGLAGRVSWGSVVSCAMIATLAAQPMPPETHEFSLDDLEEQQQTQTKRNQEARARWVQWQSRMAADFERMMKLDGSAEIAAEATSRFLTAYAADNPFSTDDERLRGLAQRRREAALGGGIYVEINLAELTYDRAPVTSYPEVSQRLREQGQVEIDAIVDTDGTIVGATVRRSSGHARLDNAARQSVLSSRFRPLLSTKSSVRVRVMIPFSFSLER